MNFNIYDETLSFKFYIDKQSLNIPFDGIIRNDFLKQEFAEINFKRISFSVPVHVSQVKIQL